MLEEILVRIAVALEKIADKNPATTITEKHEHNEDGTAKKAELTEKVQEAREAAAKKLETKPETKKAESKPETKKDEPEVTFDQCKAAFLCLAKGLRDIHGVEKMKKITLGILNDFTGGQPLSVTSLPEDDYVDFMAAIDNTIANLNAANTED